MCRIAALLLLASIAAATAADAAPNIPPSELPGRERYRFTPSPLDRFFQPAPQAEPLIRWDCDRRGKRRSKRSSWNKGC